MHEGAKVPVDDTSQQKILKEEAGGRRQPCAPSGSLGRWMYRTYLPKAAGECRPSHEVPLSDVFLALVDAHPVLAGPLYSIQQGWNKALYCGP